MARKNLERLQKWRRLPRAGRAQHHIAGFPGETEAEFEHLLQFMREAQIDRAGCFAYSPVDGAAANALAGALPDEVRAGRRARFMAVAKKYLPKTAPAHWLHHADTSVDYAPNKGKKAAKAAATPARPKLTALSCCCRPRKKAKPSRKARLSMHWWLIPAGTI